MWRSRAIEEQPVAALLPYAGNARTHSKRQVRQIADSITRFGFTNPVLVDGSGTILAGHGRLAAAKLLGLDTVPTILLDHLGAAERRAYVIADNRLAELAGWDREVLAAELQGLVDLDFEVELTGFATAEIDLLLLADDQASGRRDPACEDVIPPLVEDGPAVTRPGDLWLLGAHRLICADALLAESYEPLLAPNAAERGGEAREAVDLVFTDPPYNVPIAGHVSGLGRVRHREFAMAAGEMSRAAFTSFLATSLGAAAAASRDGAIHFVCMDWRHMVEMLAAGEGVYAELKNVCVWNKDNGGMGALYRSKHELVFVWKVGTGPHVNTVELGVHGRSRTNVWDYKGVNSFGAGRDAALALHPTVKPVALVADAILDCSRRGDLVLDPFAGSGTTLIACQMTGRRGRAVELDPLYCDRIVRRWQNYTGKIACHADTGLSFEEVAEQRWGEVAAPDISAEAGR